MKKPKRDDLDESKVTIDGKELTLREYLADQESTEIQDAHNDEAMRFNRSLRRGIKEPFRKGGRDKATYSRRFTPGEIEREEIRRMTTQAENLITALLENPKEWHSSKDLCQKAGQEPRTAGPTVGRIVEFLTEKEPEILKVRYKGRAREIMLNAEIDSIPVWTSHFLEGFAEWRRDLFRKVRAKKDKPEESKPKREVTKGKTAEELEAGLRSFLPGEKLTIEVKGSIKILFGFARSEK